MRCDECGYAIGYGNNYYRVRLWKTWKVVRRLCRACGEAQCQRECDDTTPITQDVIDANPTMVTTDGPYKRPGPPRKRSVHQTTGPKGLRDLLRLS